MPPLSGAPSYITEPKTWDTDLLAYVALTVSLRTGALTIGAVTQSGAWTVTANAGTNLNTSALATQTTLASLLTELQLKADLTETQPVSGPLTDTQLRAAAVPVSGTVTASGPLTDAQLRASAVPVSMAAIPTGGIALADTFKTRADTFTATGNGVTVSTSGAPVKSFAIQVKGTGVPATTWDIRLEGSLDNVNFSQILQHTNTTGDGTVLWSGSAATPTLYFRSRAAGLVLGAASDVVVTILGVA